jgi:ABC-type lipoprotein export system ATPase subunit
MIDQPEDNLDNSYMSKSLIPLIRKLKKRIQIVFVTHYPSIAVYGVCRKNVIIADNNNGIITYKQGGLEIIEIRKEACLILTVGKKRLKIEWINIA